jgi:vitamin B12 transporter
MGMRGGRVPSGLLVSLALAFVGSASWAEEPTSEGEELEVLVTGEVHERSGPRTILRPTDLALEASGRIENLVSDVPGMTQFRRSDARSAHPTSQGLTLRGLGGNAASRVLVLYDGVPQGDPFGGWVSWPGYDALPLASVRVLRGGGTGEHGSGALGGTLELETTEPGPEPELTAAALGGSRGASSVRLSAGLAGGGLTTSVGTTYEAGQGFVPVPPERRGPVDGPAFYEQFGTAARTRFAFSQRLSLSVAGRAFYDARSRGVVFTESENDGLDLSLHLEDRPRRAASWSLMVYAQRRELRSSFASVSPDRSAAAQVLDQYHVPASGVGGTFEVRPHLGHDVQVRLGADARVVWGRTEERYAFTNGTPSRERQAGGRNDLLGAFAAADLRLTRALVVSASGRADVYVLGGGFRRQAEIGGPVLSDETFVTRVGVEPTARVGMGLELMPGLSLRSATYTGFRLPTLNELYRPFRVGADATAANEALRTERLFGTEIGLDISRPAGIRFSLTAFENQLLGAVSNVTLASGPGEFPGVGVVSEFGSYSRRENLRSLRSLGLEASLELLGAALFDAPVLVAMSYSHVAAHVFDERTRAGARPAQVPENTLTARVSYSPIEDRLELGATLRYVGEQLEDDRGELVLASATTLDIVFAVRIVSELSIVARGENVTNSQVQVSKDERGVVEVGQPRTVWLGLAWQ